MFYNLYFIYLQPKLLQINIMWRHLNFSGFFTSELCTIFQTAKQTELVSAQIDVHR